MDSLLSTADVAKRLTADETTVRLWCRQGYFPNARQIGRGWIIPESDVANFNPPKIGRPPKSKDEASKSVKKRGGKK
jgi:predicted site-specific integrase-resolvase